ncbi:DMT family transporter [Stagnihabitans tardus]|uniref:EamA family transporter n=1 Tax=Stagnihabitans tardus TaxID=2699202 RepID=A0AAE4Y9M6_9RHOB|nr:DMT family transporter [Stagnihabitans tardus]NBZ87401.1 EamA family transporter [Stagnihabitans tardus]
MTRQGKGILLMIATVAGFAVQDGFSRMLAGAYNPFMVVMIRYWVFAAFVIAMIPRQPQGLAALKSRAIGWHTLRAALLVAEIISIVFGFTLIGLIETHAVFAACPLLVVALSSPVLGEKLTPSRLVAVAIGCLGVLVLLNPGAEVFSWAALFPLASAFMFALYTVLTRKVAGIDPFFPTFFWTPVIGAVFATLVGLPHWTPIQGLDWLWLLTYSLLSVLSYWLMQKTYQLVEASTVQPFAYLQIVFTTAIAITFFDEALTLHVLLGAGIVILAGLYTLTRAAK